MLGRFERDDRGVWFEPRFPFIAGTEYAVLVDGSATATIRRPDAPEPAARARVAAIHPSARRLPSNLLRVYVTFSQPMSEGWANRAVSIRRAGTGEVLEGAFLVMDPELWDRSRRRLTMLLDPGRIKRGLRPNRDVGGPLAEGQRITIRVDDAFRDAVGWPLEAAAERSYEIGPPVRARVTPSAWTVEAPRALTTQPLVTRFDRALDRALAERCLAVEDDTGSVVAGSVDVEDEEGTWVFTPARPWRAGVYELRVDPTLEDVAGNSVRRVFDRDLTRPEDLPLDRVFVRFSFVVARAEGERISVDR